MDPKRKIKFQDIATLALTYRYRVAKSNMLHYEKVVAYEKKIMEYLRKKNDFEESWQYEENEACYFYGTDEENKTYLLLKPDFDIYERIRKIAPSLSLELIEASQKNEALKEIGLVKTDEKMSLLRKEG